MSSSMVYRSEELKAAISSDPVALFCAEDARYSTHLEAYPRSNGEVYGKRPRSPLFFDIKLVVGAHFLLSAVCGLGGNDYPRGRVVGAARLAPGGDSEAQSDSWAPSAERAAAAHASFKGMVSLAADPPGLTQACMRPVAPDALPIVGSIPGHSGELRIPFPFRLFVSSRPFRRVHCHRDQLLGHSVGARHRESRGRAAGARERGAFRWTRSRLSASTRPKSAGGGARWAPCRLGSNGEQNDGAMTA